MSRKHNCVHNGLDPGLGKSVTRDDEATTGRQAIQDLAPRGIPLFCVFATLFLLFVHRRVHPELVLEQR